MFQSGFFPCSPRTPGLAECTLFLQQVVVYKNWKWPLGYRPVVLQVTLRHSRATSVQGCHEITGRRVVWVSPRSKLGSQGLASPFRPASPSPAVPLHGLPSDGTTLPVLPWAPSYLWCPVISCHGFPIPFPHHDISCVCTGLTLTHCQSPELSFSPQILMAQGQVLWDL